MRATLATLVSHIRTAGRQTTYFALHRNNSAPLHCECSATFGWKWRNRDVLIIVPAIRHFLHLTQKPVGQENGLCCTVRQYFCKIRNSRPILLTAGGMFLIVMTLDLWVWWRFFIVGLCTWASPMSVTKPAPPMCRCRNWWSWGRIYIWKLKLYLFLISFHLSN